MCICVTTAMWWCGARARSDVEEEQDYTHVGILS